MLGTSNPFRSSHGHDRIGGTLGSTQRSAASSERTRAQQTWLHLFQQPRASYRQVSTGISPPDQPSIESYLQTPAALALQGQQELPVVGANYEFIEPQEWPSDIVRITNNVFCTSQPYPVAKKYSNYRDDCGCDGDRCVADHGVRSWSSCINVNQDIVCDDSICFNGPECGNRMHQRLALDLISTSVGLGVLCAVAIPKDTFIIEYVGEVLLGPDARKRDDKRYQVALKEKATWSGSMDVFIDARRCGNENRFFNHSCRPNCGLYELERANTSRLILDDRYPSSTGVDVQVHGR
jgi:predicted RNA-binding Zn-ribbon protein involved in translation (DUF1610 family)